LTDVTALPAGVPQGPSSGLPAKWVPAEFRAAADAMGAAVVDRAAVITTHPAEIARRHPPELLSRQDVKLLVDLAREHDPAVIDDLTASGVGLGEVQRVLQSLLA